MAKTIVSRDVALMNLFIRGIETGRTMPGDKLKIGESISFEVLSNDPPRFVVKLDGEIQQVWQLPNG